MILLTVYKHPVLFLLVSYLLTCITVFATDRFALPKDEYEKAKIDRSPSQVLLENLARLPIIALVYAGFFAISWRPFYAFQGTASFFIIFTAISRAKLVYIREPLVFSDIALVIDLIKHKEIFYATFLNAIFWVVALGYVFGASAAYMVMEPSIVPSHGAFFWIVGGLVLGFGPWLLPLFKFANPLLVRFSEALLKTLDPKINTVRFGTFATVVYHTIVWLGRKREDVVEEIRQGLHHILAEITGEDDDPELSGPPLIVVWQSESFIDLRHFGVADLHLPHLDYLRAHASQWGRMTSVFEGGYTLRTEFAVLTGLQPEDAYADASHPYLRASHYADIAWPKRFMEGGWTTHFLHPYDRTFFLRDKALPLLGFQDMTMLDAFGHNPAVDGPYVSDKKLTQRLIQTIQSSDPQKPAFFFVASMANHGPWEPGRCGALTDPVDIYTELLRKADDALGYLTTYLDSLKRPVWLVFYGDHAPLLKSFANPFPDPRTDYVIVPLGSAKSVQPKSHTASEEAPWNLIKTIVRLAGVTRSNT